MRMAAATLALAFIVASAAEARTWRIRPGAEAEQALQTALREAHPGDTVHLAAGRFELAAGLSLSVDRVTLRGESERRSILSFANQSRGAEGLVVTANGVTLQDFAVEDAHGDAIKARDCAGVTFRGVRAEWTRGPNPNNGALGLAASNCSNVLIRDSIARGASEAGIHVGQSRNVIVRGNDAELNVAGIAIENSFNADVFGNTATRNAGGILVLDLPGLPQTGGHAIRVFDNAVTANNTANFARAGDLVASMPTGTGVMIMAGRDIHLFDNSIGDNGGANVVVVAYRLSFQDPNYDPLPRDVMVRNNRFGNAGFAPAGDLAALAQMGVVMPDVLWDGATLYAVGAAPRSENVRIVMRDNRSSRTDNASFLSLGLAAAGAPFSEAAPDPTPPPLLSLTEPPPVRLRD